MVRVLCGRSGALLLQLSLVFRCAGLLIVYVSRTGLGHLLAACMRAVPPTPCCAALLLPHVIWHPNSLHVHVLPGLRLPC